MNEKLKAVDSKALAELNQRVDDIEDLIMVEQAGVLELKKMLEEAQAKTEETKTAAAVSPEEIEKVVSGITAKLEERLASMDKKLAAFETQTKGPDVSELKKHVQFIDNRLKNLESTLNSEVEHLKETMITEDLVQTIVSEVSELRTEHGREIREIKEKIGSAPLYADIQFLSNRIKDLKQAVDNLLTMKVEIDSKILNLERSLAEMESSKLPGGLDKEIENVRRELISNGKKILTLEKTVQEISKRFENLDVGEVGKKLETIKEVETLYARIKEIHSDLQRKVESIGMMAPINVESKIKRLEEKIDEIQYSMKDMENKITKQEMPSNVFDVQIKELTEKIILLETRMKSLERMLQQPAKTEPIILE